jgi:hypothetical protein
MPHVFVEIPVAATWPSAEDLSDRDAVIEELNRLGIGTCTGAGGGMGSMDFSYRVADEAEARTAIERVMGRRMAGCKYLIRASE